MWTMYAASWLMLDDDPIIDTHRLEAETLGSLVRQCQALMENRSGLFLFWPDPNNPEMPFEHYAELIGTDVPFGRDQTITGHFATWVRHGRVIVRPLYGLKRSMRQQEQ